MSRADDPKPYLRQPDVHPNAPGGGGGPGLFSRDREAIPLGAMLADKDPKKLPVGAKSVSAAQAAAGLELNLYAKFDSIWKNAPESDILTAARAGKWDPGTDDFFFAAKSGKGEVAGVVNLLNLLVEIAKHGKRSVSRVNLFTHANAGYIGLSGEVTRAGVYFNTRDQYAALDGDLLSNIEAAGDGFSFTVPGSGPKKQYSLGDARAALASDAVLVVYACHAGLDKEYLKRFATALGIKVIGFKESIIYKLTPQGGKVVRTYGREGASSDAADFHDIPLPPAVDP